MRTKDEILQDLQKLGKTDTMQTTQINLVRLLLEVLVDIRDEIRTERTWLS